MTDPTEHQSYSSFVRTDVFHLLPQNCERILELGPAQGRTLAALRESRECIFAVGVEYDAGSAMIARKTFDEVLSGNVEQLDLPEHWADFDLVLCLDVLEHLVDPWQMVARLKERMANGATMIVSLPNVSYWPVSLGLALRGRWTLTDAGVMDRTHLRFFVRETAIELIDNAGLQVLLVEAGNLKPGSKRYIVNKLTFGLFERFLASQYYLVAQKT